MDRQIQQTQKPYLHLRDVHRNDGRLRPQQRLLVVSSHINSFKQQSLLFAFADTKRSCWFSHRWCLILTLSLTVSHQRWMHWTTKWTGHGCCPRRQCLLNTSSRLLSWLQWWYEPADHLFFAHRRVLPLENYTTACNHVLRCCILFRISKTFQPSTVFTAAIVLQMFYYVYNNFWARGIKGE